MRKFKANQGRLRHLRWPVRLTWLALMCERGLQAFWPCLSVIGILLASLMLRLHEFVPSDFLWLAGVLALVAILATFGVGLHILRWPSRRDALARLDESLPDQPIQAILDQQAIGINNSAATAIWRLHQQRMLKQTQAASFVRPDLRLANRDPFALRFIALIAVAVAITFGSISRVGSIGDITPPALGSAAAIPTWEGWVEPPPYTKQPTIYLHDLATDTVKLPQFTQFVLRFYGEPDAITFTETVSRPNQEALSDDNSAHRFEVQRSGELIIAGASERQLQIAMVADQPPQISIEGTAKLAEFGQFALPYAAQDDYGVVAAEATIVLNLAEVSRTHGLQVDPEPRADTKLLLPLPIVGDRALIEDEFSEDFAEHPWANLPVTITLTAVDEIDNQAETEAYATTLVARRFFDPLAAAIAEQRRDLLWSRENAKRVALILRALSHRPEDVFDKDAHYLRLRYIIRRLEAQISVGLSNEHQEEIASALWDLALLLEEGDLSDALARMQRAQERLSEAMRNGATDQEIAELMQELRQATQDYLNQLSRQAQNQQQGDADQRQLSENALEMTQDDLQRMMDRIQELLEQGRMAEAQQALEEFQRLMENMRVTQGGGQNGQSPGERALQDLSRTLRQQQDLSDQAFRDLQEQFGTGQLGNNSDIENGESGEGESLGSDGLGRGQGQTENQRDGRPNGGGTSEQGLANRQRDLRGILQEQQGRLPGAGTPSDEVTNDALDRAGRAMEEAEQSLRNRDLAEAIDQQSEAIEALRDAMRSLGDALAQNQSEQSGSGNQNSAFGNQFRDPLGRRAGSQGGIDTRDGLLQGDDVYRRARDLLDEIRRRSGEGSRPDLELEYLRRLLERF